MVHACSAAGILCTKEWSHWAHLPSLLELFWIRDLVRHSFLKHSHSFEHFEAYYGSQWRDGGAFNIKFNKMCNSSKNSGRMTEYCVPGGTVYNPDRSSTAKNTGKQFQIQYGIGATVGTLYEDVFYVFSCWGNGNLNLFLVRKRNWLFETEKACSVWRGSSYRRRW